jgi:hypothetical protein
MLYRMTTTPAGHDIIGAFDAISERTPYSYRPSDHESGASMAIAAPR